MGKIKSDMEKIKIVLPDGSMMEKMLALFDRASMPITIKSKRTKEGSVECEFIDRVAFQRPAEIPSYVQAGLFDIGFVGEDWLDESMANTKFLLSLPMGRAKDEPVKIVVAVKKNSKIKKIDDLPQNCRVATEYINLTKKNFIKLGRPDIDVMLSHGNTEGKISLGLAKAIVDVTESGDSLTENGLRVIHTIMKSRIAMIANIDSFYDQNKRPFISCIAGMIKGASEASKYALLIANVPEHLIEDASRIMAGLKGPTRSPVTSNDSRSWYALQSIVSRDKIHCLIIALNKIGVDDMVVQDIRMLVTEQDLPKRFRAPIVQKDTALQ
jgi:ATP phosphoribosyltransferase